MGPPLASPGPALRALLEGVVVTGPRKVVGQGLRPLPKPVPHGCPGEQEALGLDPSSHIAQLHGDEVSAGQMRLKGRTLVLPGCGWHRGCSLGLGPSTQHRCPGSKCSSGEFQGRKLRQSQALWESGQAVESMRLDTTHSWV